MLLCTLKITILTDTPELLFLLIEIFPLKKYSKYVSSAKCWMLKKHIKTGATHPSEISLLKAAIRWPLDSRLKKLSSFGLGVPCYHKWYILRKNVTVMGCILKRTGTSNPEEKADTLNTKLMSIIFLNDECWDHIDTQNKYLNRKKSSVKFWHVVRPP